MDEWILRQKKMAQSEANQKKRILQGIKPTSNPILNTTLNLQVFFLFGYRKKPKDDWMLSH